MSRKLEFEALEDRYLLSSYIWNPPANQHAWNVLGNWRTTAMTPPGNGDDVTFNDSNTAYCDGPTPQYTLHSLTFTTGAGKLNLVSPEVVTNGFYMHGGSITQTGNAQLTLTGDGGAGNPDVWDGGDINNTATVATLRIAPTGGTQQSPKTFNFVVKGAPGTCGDNIVIGDSNNSYNQADVYLADQTQQVTLLQNTTVTVNSGSSLYFSDPSGTNTGGIKADNGNTCYLDNSGVVGRDPATYFLNMGFTGTGTTVKLSYLPIRNEVAGTVVFSASKDDELLYVSGGNTNTKSVSFYNHGGLVTLIGMDDLHPEILNAAAGYYQDLSSAVLDAGWAQDQAGGTCISELTVDLGAYPSAKIDIEGGSVYTCDETASQRLRGTNILYLNAATIFKNTSLTVYLDGSQDNTGDYIKTNGGLTQDNTDTLYLHAYTAEYHAGYTYTVLLEASQAINGDCLIVPDSGQGWTVQTPKSPNYRVKAN